MAKDSPLKIYGILGYPVKHSLSPLMQNAAFRALNLNAKYVLFEKTPDELESFFGSFEKENICGLNVTVPYKEKVIPFLSRLSEEAQLIGAVNTIRVSGKKLEGFNTDGEGFIRHLISDLRFDPRGKRAVILGAGGASKAVSVYLSISKIRAISIYDIDKNKLNNLVGQLKNNFKGTEFNACNSLEELKINQSHLLINATPVGMKEDDPCLLSEDMLHPDLLVYDLIYNPRKTKLLEVAQKRGAGIANGLGMLLHQGTASFKIWTALEPPLAAMRQALEKGV